MKHFLQVTHRIRLNFGHRDDPIILGLAQIIMIRPLPENLGPGCLINLTDSCEIETAETFAEIASAIGGLENP